MAQNVTVNLKFDQAYQRIENACAIAIRQMMEDVHTLSTPITPYKGGHLRTSVSKQMVSPTVGVMTWHAPYAEYQERGYGKYPFVHYTTPGTHAGFIEESINRVVAQLPRYIQLGGLV